MGYEWAHSGSVKLRPGTTLQDVLNLYRCNDDQPHLPLTESGEAELEEGHVWLKVDSEFLDYRADGDSFHLDEEVTGFLGAVADELAAEGWIDYEIEDFEVPFGPTPLARAQARLQSARSATKAVQKELVFAEAEVRRLQDAQA
ncbi:MAG TPA: hypothetical protein VHX64_00490 [Caulobacteraceae bacterium]|nr:hypothetical protein [Caulobacteraceae bacterium]